MANVNRFGARRGSGSSDMGPRDYVIGAGILAAAAAVYFGAAWQLRSHRSVWFVSGVDVAYDVKVDGRHVTLAPLSAVPLALGSGTHELVVTVPGSPVRTVSVVDDVPLAYAPLDWVLYDHIINPDQTAVVSVERQVYRASPLPQDEPSDFTWDALPPQLLHVVKSDYEFVEFPDRIDGGRVGRSTMTRVVAATSTAEAAWWLAEKLPAEVLPFWRRRFALDAHDGAAIAALVEALPAKESLALLETRLDERPTSNEAWLAWSRLNDDDDASPATVARLRKNQDSCAAHMERFFGVDVDEATLKLSASCWYDQAATALDLARDGDVDGASALIATIPISSRTPALRGNLFEVTHAAGRGEDWVAFTERMGDPQVIVARKRMEVAHHRGDGAAAESARQRAAGARQAEL